TEKAKYLENDRVQYRCNPGYVLEGPEWIQCKGQEWTPRPPKCLAPCSITRQQLAAKNLFVFGNQRKARLIQSNQSLQFQCNEGYVLVVPSVRKCVDGYMDLPLCISEITCKSPRIPNGTFRPQRTIYHDGDLIRMQCDSGFTFEPDNGEKVVECTKNGWSPPLKC
ncbi:Complement factor H, partial [Ophiophagus hannah]